VQSSLKARKKEKMENVYQGDNRCFGQPERNEVSSIPNRKNDEA
jgi:hypothetical protein